MDFITDADATTATTTFDIPAHNVGAFLGKIEALDKKAQKLGCGHITATKVGEHVRVEKHERTGLVLREYVVHEYTVSGDAPQYNGWTFVAVLEAHEAGVLCNVLPGETLPESYRIAPSVCDHCGTNRRRLATYIVRSESGEYKQVGSTCLRDFLGHQSPERIAAYCEMLLDLKDADAIDDERGRSSYGISADTFLSYVACGIRTLGWVSRGAAREAMSAKVIATADRAIVDMFERRPTAEALSPEQQDRDMAKTVIAWVRGELAARQDLNDYLWNVVVSLGDDTLTLRSLGVAASAVNAYRREQEQAIERRQQFGDSNFVGVEGGKVELSGLVCVGMNEISDPYTNGVSYLNRFRDPAGNVVIWFASNFKAEVGKVYSGKGKVKKHDVYKGVKQTAIFYAKLAAV